MTDPDRPPETVPETGPATVIDKAGDPAPDALTPERRRHNGPPPPEVIAVKTRRVACNGGGGALGHPIVWYSLEDGEAECGYCDRKFVYDPKAI